ncbi:MAG: hypothetical protein AAFY60_08780 [Myxococcota bacterium]
MGISAQLLSTDGTVLWRGRFRESEDFFPDASTDAQGILATETNERRRALYRLTERLAAEVVRSMQRASL